MYVTAALLLSFAFLLLHLRDNPARGHFYPDMFISMSDFFFFGTIKQTVRNHVLEIIATAPNW